MKTKMLASALTVLVSQTVTMAGDMRRCDEFTLCLQNESARVCREIYVGMRRDPNFRTTYKLAYNVYSLSCHLRDTVRGREDMDHIWADMEELDEAFHELEEELNRIGWCGPRARQCRISPSVDFHRRRMERHVEMFDKALHQMIAEVDYVPTPSRGVQPPAVLTPPVPPNVIPQRGPSIQSSGRSARFNGPRFDEFQRSAPTRMSIPIGKSGFRFNLVLR